MNKLLVSLAVFVTFAIPTIYWGQGAFGSPEQVSGAIVLLLQLGSALLIAVRQVLQGRSTLVGARPKNFRGR